MEMLQMDVSIRHKGPHIQRSIDQKCCSESSHLIGCLDIFNNGIKNCHKNVDQWHI